MNIDKLSRWMALATLALLVTGPMSRRAYAAGQAQINQQVTAGDQQVAGKVALVALAEPAAEAEANLAAPPPPPHHSSGRWTGPYVGINAGFANGNADTFVNPLPTAAIFVSLLPQTLHPDPSGAVGGGQVGFNWQRRLFVLGAEFDISGSGIDGTQTVSPIIQNNGTPIPGVGNHITAHQDITWFSTVRPRLGIAVYRLLVYGTGGLAFGHVNNSADTDFRPTGTEHYPASSGTTKTGWAAGAGAELALPGRWSVRGEYLHMDLGSQSITANPSIPFPPSAPNFQVAYTWQSTTNIGRFGLNFRF